MYNYLEPVDDGLPMRKSGSWVAEKLDYVRRYVATFVTSMRSKPWRAINYIDLFSGPGKCVDEQGRVYLGSPLLALRAPFPFTTCYFNDLEPSSHNALRLRCAAASGVRIVQHSGDANTVVTQIAPEIRELDHQFMPGRWSSLNLAFLDPEGLELHWDTITSLGSVNRMDMIIYYPQQALERNMLRLHAQVEDSAIDLYFGSRGWRTVYKQAVASGKSAYVHRLLMDHYKERLGTLGYVDTLRDDEVYDEPLIRNAKRNAPLYRLLFASKDLLGVEFWRQVAQRNVHGQQRLFEH